METKSNIAMNKYLNSILGDPVEISSLKKIYNVVNFEYSSEALDQKVFLDD